MRSKLSTYSDFLEEDFIKKSGYLNETEIHRKRWELISCIQAFELSPRKRCLVFGVGNEVLPEFLAGYVDVESILATDLVHTGNSWDNTNQLCKSKDQLFRGGFTTKEIFDKKVSFVNVDMNHIPDLGQFDFIWSICAFEHLGSIEKGIEFIHNSNRLLAPGGIACHTTEFNTISNRDTLDNASSVFFRHQDIERIRKEVIEKGFQMEEVDYSLGNHVNDIDCAVKDRRPHLKVRLDPYVITCIRLIIKR